jgi:hypothetical protein
MTPWEVKEREHDVISVIELKRLLIELKEKKPCVLTRFRLLGELWATNFMSIAAVTEKGVIFKDDINNSFVVLSNLSDVIQFEIDEPFQGYKPFNHYIVTPSAEF